MSNNSILFDGHNAKIELPLSLSTALDSSNWTIEGWVDMPRNYYHSSEHQVIFSVGSNIIFYLDSFTNKGKIYHNGTTDSATFGKPDGNIHYFAVTSDNSTIKIYVDALEFGSFSTTSSISSSDQIVICDFIGRADNFAIYDKVLSQETLKQHYSAGRCDLVKYGQSIYKAYISVVNNYDIGNNNINTNDLSMSIIRGV